MRKKEKIISIEATKITERQWSTLLIELNLMKESWAHFGVRLNLKAPSLDKIIKWGKHTPSKSL